MKYFILAFYVFAAAFVPTIYSNFFNIDFIGNFFAIMGYKVLWGVIGMGYVYFDKWIMDR